MNEAHEAPYLFSENFVYALLLDSIIEACSTNRNSEIDSKSNAAYARAIRELALCELVDVKEENGDSITAVVSDKGNAYIVQLFKEEEEEKKSKKR